MYSSSMDDWLKSTQPFASSKHLANKDQEMQDGTTNHLKNNLKGPNEFKTLFISQLQKVYRLCILSAKFVNHECVITLKIRSSFKTTFEA